MHRKSMGHQKYQSEIN